MTFRTVPVRGKGGARTGLPTGCHRPAPARARA